MLWILNHAQALLNQNYHLHIPISYPLCLPSSPAYLRSCVPEERGGKTFLASQSIFFPFAMIQ